MKFNFFRKEIGLILFTSLCFSLIPVIALARVGVGVGIGKIQVDKPLKAGLIYNLPSLPVLNTGDEPSQYEVSIEYHENVPELRPAREWFKFEPQSFYLEPGQTQSVRVTLTIPLKTKPGNYFAYLEGHPIKKAEKGTTSVGIAAAAKLYFTVKPSNIFEGIYYRFISLYSQYHPWDTIILVVIFVVLVITYFSKKFKIQIAKK
jgi:P pilus assembly chaperone PapD